MQPDDSVIDVPQSPHNAGSLVSAYPHLADQMFGRPLLIHQPAMDAVLHAMAPRMGFAVNGQAELHQVRQPHAAVTTARGRRTEGGYTLMKDGTAIVTMTGKLMNRASWMDSMSGLESYANVERVLAEALADPDVSRIVLEVDSPGGTVAGAFDFAERVFESRGSKPIIAAPSEMAASAAYLVASAADEIVIPQTGSVGSVGVVVALLNREKAMQKAGLAMTYIFAGDKKVDGNPFEPLPDRVRAEIQEEIDDTYALFVDRVAKYRRMSPAAVRATQAGMYSGQKAIEAGFADRIDSFANVVTHSRRDAARTGSRTSLATQSQEVSMTDAEKAAADKAQTEAVAAARAEGLAAGIKQGAEVERTRIESILGHEEAAVRADSAKHLAFKTAMPANDATALLATMPKAAAAAPAKEKSALEKAMDATGGGPKIGLDAPEGDNPNTMTADDVWAKVIPHQKG